MTPRELAERIRVSVRIEGDQRRRALAERAAAERDGVRIELAPIGLTVHESATPEVPAP